MKIEPYEKKRAIFMFLVMFPALLLAQFFGWQSTIVAAVLAGVVGGVSVVIFPRDPGAR